MSEEALRRLLDRLNDDEAFAQKLRDDWQDAIDDLGLSSAELVALEDGDEDALRRLSGAEVAGHQFRGQGPNNLLHTLMLCQMTIGADCRPNTLSLRCRRGVTEG
jgi:hypothetical protein